MKKIKPWIWRIISSGLPVNNDLEILRKIFLVNLMILLGGLASGLLIVVAFFQGDYTLVASDLTFFLFMLWLFLYLRRTKYHNLISIIGSIGTGFYFSFLIAYGGPGNTAFVWVFTYPLITLLLLGVWWGTCMVSLLLGMMCIIFALDGNISFLAFYETNLEIRLIAAYITIYLFAFLMEKVREIIQNRLKETNIELEKANIEKEGLIAELHQAIQEVQILQGILPICAHCKKIRDDKGYWAQLEEYIQDRSNAQFSHSICPECARQLYPDINIGKA